MLTDEEWKEIKENRERDRKKDEDRQKYGTHKKHGNYNAYVNPWWYVLLGLQLISFVYSLFVQHYISITNIYCIVLIIMRISGKITTVYFWPWYLVGGFAIGIIEYRVFILPQINASVDAYMSNLFSILFVLGLVNSCS